MRRKDIRKRKGIRYAEYYNMVEIQDELYRQGMMKKKFYHLMPIIASPQNIRLAYRNLKNNKGSNTPGVDGKTFISPRLLGVYTFLNQTGNCAH